MALRHSEFVNFREVVRKNMTFYAVKIACQTNKRSLQSCLKVISMAASVKNILWGLIE